tara:strand:+ start:424 stop:630 length:207 start_codon:yes stop_codon:yes gene_type:complete
MSDTSEVLTHLNELQDAAKQILNVISDYKHYSGDWTTAKKTAEMAKITTVSAGTVHAANCSICTGWTD